MIGWDKAIRMRIYPQTIEIIPKCETETEISISIMHNEDVL